MAVITHLIFEEEVEIMFVDTHTHMDHHRFDSDKKSIIQIAKDSGIDIFVNPAIEYETNYTMRQMLDGYE